jgi:hypothetical protein
MDAWTKEPVTSLQLGNCSGDDIVTFPFYGTQNLCRKDNYSYGPDFTIGTCPTDTDSDGSSTTVGTDIDGIKSADLLYFNQNMMTCISRQN